MSSVLIIGGLVIALIVVALVLRDFSQRRKEYRELAEALLERK